MTLPNPFTAIYQSIADMVHGVSIDDVITNDLAKTEREIVACDQSILTHQFLKHMAKAKQQAMIDWVKRENGNA